MQKQYAQLSAQIKELEAQKKELGQKIMEDMIERREKKEMFDYGTFSVGIRRKYKYSNDFVLASEQLKEMKVKEEAEVDWDEVPYITFKQAMMPKE